MVEAAEPEGDALDPFDEVVDRIGRAVGDVGVVPGNDLRLPADDRAPETTNFGRHPRLAEIAADRVDPLASDHRVGVFVDLTDDFFGGPCGPHCEVRIAGGEQSHQPLVPVDGQALAGHHQPSSSPVKRIVASATMAERVVLHPASALVDGPVRQGDHIEKLALLYIDEPCGTCQGV